MPNCKPGDIAIIIKDEAGCECNIGRLVHVSGPAGEDWSGMLTWLIYPVNPLEPYLYQVYRAGGKTRFMNLEDRNIEHPDAWMVPLPKAELQGESFDANELEILEARL